MVPKNSPLGETGEELRLIRKWMWEEGRSRIVKRTKKRKGGGYVIDGLLRYGNVN